MKIKGFITHKKAEEYSDCADFFKINSNERKIAVSDGVSQSFDPQDWSRILVKSYIDGSWNPGDDLKPMQQLWLEKINERLHVLEESGAITYGMENMINSRVSAAGTFCGIEFNGNEWSCKVIGDSSLICFSPKGEMEICSSKEGTFDNRPDYFDSYEKDPVGEIKTFSGTLKEGDVLLLVSDPFSELFQKAALDGNPGLLLGLLLSVESQDDFVKMVDRLRDEYGMHNDDSTLVVIENDGKEEFDITCESSLEELIEEQKRLENENAL